MKIDDYVTIKEYDPPTHMDIIFEDERFQADYENRLKSDVIAILKELQLDVEKHTMTSGVTNQDTWNKCIACCSMVIQLKINDLEGGQIWQ